MTLSSLPTEIQVNIFRHLNPDQEDQIRITYPKAYTLSPISCTNRALHAAYVTWFYGRTTLVLEFMPLRPSNPDLLDHDHDHPHWTAPNATPLIALLSNVSLFLISTIRKLRISAHTSELLWLFAPPAALRILNIPLFHFPHWTTMRQTLQSMRINVLEVELLRPAVLDWTRNNHPLNSRLWPDTRWVLKALKDTMGEHAQQIVFKPFGMSVELDLAYPTFPPEVDWDAFFQTWGRAEWSWEALASSRDSFVRQVCFLGEGRSCVCGGRKFIWYVPAVRGSVNQPFEEGEWMFGEDGWQRFRSRLRPQSEYLEELHGTVMGRLLGS